MRAVALLGWLVTTVATARADDNPSLAAARRAVSDVRYDDAQPLLVEALKRGDNAPAAVVEIYQLSAATATVLGQRELAEQYYRRWLALEPNAALPADASPRLRAPFSAAQAYMVAQGRLELRAERAPDGSVTVTLVSDPLAMVRAVAPVVGGTRGTPQPLSTTATASFGGERPPSAVVVIDEHGNALRIVAMAPPAATVREPPPIERPVEPRLPIVRRWQSWAIAAGITAAVGGGFTIDGALARRRLDDILAANRDHFFAEAEAERVRYQRSTLIGDIGLGVAGALAVVVVVLYARRPRSPPLQAWAMPGGLGVAASF